MGKKQNFDFDNMREIGRWWHQSPHEKSVTVCILHDKDHIIVFTNTEDDRHAAEILALAEHEMRNEPDH